MQLFIEMFLCKREIFKFKGIYLHFSRIQFQVKIYVRLYNNDALLCCFFIDFCHKNLKLEFCF